MRDCITVRYTMPRVQFQHLNPPQLRAKKKRARGKRTSQKYQTSEEKKTKSQTGCNISSRFVSSDRASRCTVRIHTYTQTRDTTFNWALKMWMLPLQCGVNNRFYVKICDRSQIFRLHHLVAYDK